LEKAKTTTMGQAEHKTSDTTSVENIQNGTVIDVPSTARNVSRLIPRNTTTMQILFYALAFFQAYQNGYDASVMNGLNILPSYTSYFTLTTTSLALNTASFWVGGILSGLVAGQFCDWTGRKWTMFWSSILCIIGAVIQACAQNIGMFVASRIIIGFACGLACVGASTYLAETVTMQNRAFILGFFWDAWWAGSLIAAGITFGTKSILNTWAWRAPSLLQVLPSLLCIGILPFLPESPRWLVYQDRVDEAFEVLAVVHARGDMTDQVVIAEHREITETLAFEKIAGSVSPLEVIRTPGNRKRILLCLSVGLFSMTMGNNIVTYYLGTMLDEAGVTNFNTQLIVNIILSVWAFACSLIGTLFMDSLGRRMLALISTALGTIFLFLVGGFSALYGSGSNTSGSYATVAMMFLFIGAYSLGWTPLSMMYPVEVLNYSTRATGMGMYTFLANGVGLMITFAFPYAFDAIGWKTYMINSAFNALALAFVWFYWVETKGKTLEEMDEMMDGEKHADVPDVIDIINGKAVV
jgi:sugar porter (SP) family MFS transporter